jgi:methylase of polypeptide subunit release factors
MARKEKAKWEFGDFQTPVELAREAVSVLVRRGLRPATVIEPSCGKGAFFLAALEAFPEAACYVGSDINEQYLEHLRSRIREHPSSHKCRVQQADFFHFNWKEFSESASSPVLVLGNPPWVTSAELGMLGSNNLPAKSNFQGRRGLDAVTGKSNFDISEWMLLESMSWLKNGPGAVAVICKSSVARKILQQGWKNSLLISSARMYSVDANKHFGAAVDACFFVIEIGAGPVSHDCAMFDSLSDTQPRRSIGYHDETLISDVELYERWRHLRGEDSAYTWRSGVKHDCSKVMELEKQGERFQNQLGELVDLEDEYVFPMLKSSDLATSVQVRYGRKYMLVTQSLVGENTDAIQINAPRTWDYLLRHRALLDARGSSIYKKRPSFSVFGVGDYAFAPWKVAISGFYKSLNFKVVEPVLGRPVVLDDTAYFLPCWSREEADFIAQLLASKPAQDFLRSMIFWDEKRPITVELLKRLDMHSVAIELGLEESYTNFARRRRDRQSETTRGQMSLGIAEKGRRYRASSKTRT